VLGKHILQAAEKTELTITFATANAPGPFEKIVTIDVERPEKRQYEVIMTGRVKEAPGAKISMASRKIEVGNLKAGEQRKQVIKVTNTGELPLVIQRVSVKGEGRIKVAAEGLPIDIKGGQTAEIELRVTGIKAGEFIERVSIESNAKNAPKTGYIMQLTGKIE
jgi:hypothetical protein